MDAVINIAGKQIRVAEKQIWRVPKLKGRSKGEAFTIDEVLMISDEKGVVTTGTPSIEGAKVHAELVGHVKEKKKIIFKKKRRKGFTTTRGFRPQASDIKITKIVTNK